VIPRTGQGASTVDGFAVQPVTVETVDEQNLSALAVSIDKKDGTPVERTLL